MKCCSHKEAAIALSRKSTAKNIKVKKKQTVVPPRSKSITNKLHSQKHWSNQLLLEVGMSVGEALLKKTKPPQTWFSQVKGSVSTRTSSSI